MKIKKRLKYKSTLPKADFSMNASNMNRAAAEEAHAERAAAQRAAHEETPAQGGGMGAAGAMNIATQGLNFISSLTPQDNDDGIGMSHKASKITSGISTGLDTASQMAGSFNPIAGAAIGGVSALFKMIKGAVDHKRENDRSITSRLARKEYDPTQDNVGYSFGNGTAKYGMPLFGDGGIPSFKNGGEPLYVTNPNDPRLKSYQDSSRLFNQSVQQIVDINQELKAAGKTSSSTNMPYNSRTAGDEYNETKKQNIVPVALKKIQVKNAEGVDGTPYGWDVAIYPKPKQVVEYKKQQVDKPTPAVTTKTKVPQKVTPIYTSDPNDKRLKAYNDSSTLHKLSITNDIAVKNGKYTPSSWIDFVNKDTSMNKSWDNLKKLNGQDPKPIKRNSYFNGDIGVNIFKKPVQPVILKPVPRAGNINIRTESLEGFKNGGEPTMKEYKDFNNFRKTVNPDYLGKDYDLQSAFLELPSKTLYDWQQNPEKNHLPDTYKLPNHPTFSTESKYYKPGMPAGYWKGDTYVPIDRPASTVTTNTNLLGLDDPNKQKNIMNKELERNNGVRPGYALGGDPRSQSNIEAEQGEAMQHSSGKIENIEGQKHENGGTPLQVQPSHEYIYSDSLGYDREGNMTLDENLVRYSFADNAKKIERKYKGRENDSIVQKTKKLELGKLKQDAEQARVAKEEMEMGKQMKKYKAKYGANLKRFDNSGNPQPSSIQPSSIMTPEEMKKMYDDLQLKAAGVTGGLNQTITDLQQTSKQLDNTNQQLQQSSTSLTKPTINKPLYNTLDTGDYFYEPTKLQTSWGTYGTDGNLIQKQSVIQPTPQPLFGGGNRINHFVGPRVPSRRDNLREAANFYTPGQVGTPKPMAQAQDRQEDIAPDAVKKNGFFGDLTTGDKMQLASMLPAFGFNMGMGLRKADVEPNRKNPYENDVLSMMANRKFDIQNYLNQSNLATNTAKEDIGNNSTSVGGKMANLQKLFANQSNALGDITTKGQEMNNQYRAEEANTKNIIGEANRAESIRAAGINDQNKARKQQFLAKAFEQMGQGLATTGQAANQSLTNKLLIKSLSEISPDFDVKNMKDLQVGDDGYIVFKGVKTEFKMSNEGKIVMAGGTPNTANAAKSQYAPKDFTMKAFANFTKPKKK